MTLLIKQSRKHPITIMLKRLLNTAWREPIPIQKLSQRNITDQKVWEEDGTGMRQGTLSVWMIKSTMGVEEIN